MSWEPPVQMGRERAESPAGLRRLLRIRPGQRRLALVGGAVLLTGVVLFRQTPGAAVAPTTQRATTPSPFTTEASPSSSPTSIAAAGYEGYAIYLFKLPGLAPDTPTGTKLKVWVTWKPSVGRGNKLQLLIPDAILGRIEEPYGDDGPLIAELLVRPRQIAHLIYGEKYGSFNVSVMGQY